MCFNNVVSILNRVYVKKTDDINSLNRARSHTDGEHGEETCPRLKSSSTWRGLMMIVICNAIILNCHYNQIKYLTFMLECRIMAPSLAISYIYFSRMFLKFVRRANSRHFVSGCCLFYGAIYSLVSNLLENKKKTKNRFLLLKNAQLKNYTCKTVYMVELASLQGFPLHFNGIKGNTRGFPSTPESLKKIILRVFFLPQS